MDKNNDNKIPDDIFEEADTKKKLVMGRIRKAQPEPKEPLAKTPVRKASKKKKNAAVVPPSPIARSPAAFSPVAKKIQEEKVNDVLKHLKSPVPRPEEKKSKDKKGKKTITETEEEELTADRMGYKFIEHIGFIETGPSLNTYYLTHLLNMAQPMETHDAFTRNTFKNRNPDVFCIDKTRVKLMDPNIEYYIHANHIKFDRLTRTYIATQHPLPGTLNDFWAMIADQKVELIVSLTNSKTASFPIYYPNKPSTFRNFGQFFVYCNSVIPPKTKYGFTEYKFDFVAQSEKEEKRTIRLYHYPHWVKNTVPASTKVVLEIVKKLRKKRSNAPVVVQCETGVNQSAEVIYVDAMCSMLDSGVEANFDSLFRQMRQQKSQVMTQRLHFLHSIATVLDFIKYHFSSIPDHLICQMASIMFSISKDFQYNMSEEPIDEKHPLKSPPMFERNEK
ncbi:hypothetical protein B9Z55_006677 [Caenorhabditis nigoni]|uniref:Tyrosine-protein phosphatase domain-containing protein n=1 Tax=Caenorhabditis nigoni TaxID=1611254 RepID=A0A2G5V6W8_9PELO|nr:hypothetical protein B9Z55_006677 [Caenorhabditis nigoni]